MASIFNNHSPCFELPPAFSFSAIFLQRYFYVSLTFVVMSCFFSVSHCFSCFYFCSVPYFKPWFIVIFCTGTFSLD